MVVARVVVPVTPNVEEKSPAVPKRVPEIERLVEEALARYVCPDTVSAVADAVVKVDCPVAFMVEVKKEVVVSAVVDAVASTVCPVTVRLVEDALAKVV